MLHYAMHEFGTFVGHEWVAESTISQHSEEILDLEFNHKFDIFCIYGIETNFGRIRLRGESTTKLTTGEL